MKPINHIDGWLYVTIAVCTAVTATMSSADAQQFYSPQALFLIKTYAGIFGAAALAGKTYRSTTFARAQDAAAAPSANPPPSTTGGVTSALIIGLLLLGLSARADNAAGPSQPDLMPPAQYTTLDNILSAVPTPTNYAAEFYGTYAPKAPEKFGGGVLFVYDVNQSVGLGLGIDWLGQLSLVSANLTLQAPFHPLKNQFPHFVLSPLVIGGIGTAYSGAGRFNGGVSTIEDVGFFARFGHAWGGEFNVGACWGQWTGVGAYDVKRYHAFAGWTHGI